MILPQNVKSIIEKFYENGYTAFAVGGCVRDSIMGKTPNDYDICTSATPQKTTEIFGSNNTVPTGIKHGTVTVLIDKTPYEVTTFRTECNYSDNRHPDNVSFVTDIASDLMRRDFTINAMAYNDNNGLIDLYGGTADIKSKIVRCVGNADSRFNEDGLRILRALRFASVLNFDIEENTKKAIFGCKHLLKNITSGERIYSEFSKLICGDNAEKILMEYKEVIAEFLPQIKSMFNLDQHNPHHCYDVWQHTVKAVVAAPQEIVLRLTMLLHDTGKPSTFFTDEKGIGHFYGHPMESRKIAENVLDFFHCDNKTKEQVLYLVEYHDLQIAPNEKSVKRSLRKISTNEFLLLMTVKRCDATAQSTYEQKEKFAQIDKVESIYKNLIDNGYCTDKSKLKINGNDLIQLGAVQGKKIGNILDYLLKRVQNNQLANEKQALLKAAKKRIKNNN